MSNHRAEHGKVTPGHISMVIGPMVCCQAGSAQVVQQESVHSSEGGTENLLALCERAGSAQAVQQASVHTSEGGTEKLLALCERAMCVK